MNRQAEDSYRILIIVPWKVVHPHKIDKALPKANVVLGHGRYWFFEHWNIEGLHIDVYDFASRRLLRFAEDRILKFHIVGPLKVLRGFGNYDLVICFHSKAGIVPALVRWFRRQRKPPFVVMDIEGMARKSGGIFSWLLKKAVSGISLVIYFARIQLTDYQRFLPELTCKAEYIPLGIDHTRYISHIVSPEELDSYLVAIGYQSQAFRDWATLLGAYNLLEEKPRLLIVGKKTFTPKETLGEPIPQEVEFVGPVGIEQMIHIVAKARGVILPLPERRHSYGCLTLLGCMALGKAVITSRCSGVVDYVQDNVDTLLYDAGNAVDLANKITFLRDPYIVRTLGEAAKRSAVTKFTEKIMADKLLDILTARFPKFYNFAKGVT